MGADPEQYLHATSMLGGLQIRAGDSGMCLDAAGGNHLLVYPCYESKIANYNQVWHVEGNLLVWHGDRKGYCVDSHAVKADLSSMPLSGVTLQTCASKLGQRFQKHDVNNDGAFLLRDADDENNCLCGPMPSFTVLRICSCSAGERWRELKEREQVQHIASGKCMDQGNGNSPGLWTCHQPVAQLKQRFVFIDPPGWLQLH